MNDSKLRADKILALVFPEYNRNQLQELITQGQISFFADSGEWQLLKKSSQKFPKKFGHKKLWRISDSLWNKFVSRAGIKLDFALREFNIDAADKICLDVGLSTGGFSDCLLQRGAKRILGIDVGTEQLHKKLRDDARLMYFDKINARYEFPETVLKTFFAGQVRQFDLIVVDVSFISLDKITDNLVTYMAPAGILLALVKPQFELGANALNKKGVVKKGIDPVAAVEKNQRIFAGQSLKTLAYCTSPIEGDNGNQEYFIFAKKSD